MDLYQRLNSEFAFALDVCGTAPTPTAVAYAYDDADTHQYAAFSRDWAADAGGTIWVRPRRTGVLSTWLKKAIDTAQEGAVVVCLIPVRAEQDHWHDHVLNAGAEVRFVRGRLRTTGTNASSNASVVVVYRPTDILGTPATVTSTPAVHTPARLPTIDLPPDERVEHVIANYTPTKLPADKWTHAADVVRRAIRATNPPLNNTSSTLAALTGYLAQSPLWDGVSAPDLQTLLTESNINAWATTVDVKRTRDAYRCALRNVATAIEAKDVAGTPLATSVGRHRYPHPLLVEGSELPIPAATLLRTWMHHAGNTMRSNPLEPVVKHWKSTPTATAPPSFLSTVTSSAATRALTEVADPEKATVTSPSDAPAGAHKPSALVEPKRGPAGSKPLSRRQALLHAKRVRTATAEATAPPAIPDAPSDIAQDIVDAIRAYRPVVGPRETWLDNHELGVRLVLGHRPPSVNSAKTVCSYVSRYLHWYVGSAHRPAGHTGPIGAAELLDGRLIEHHLNESTDLTDRAKGTIRSALRRAVNSLNPNAKPEKVPHFPALAPYTPEECARYVALAINQPTITTGMNLGFIVGLGLGAGLDANDINSLTRGSFSDVSLDDGTVVLLVTTAGSRPRTVPIRRAYEPVIRKALSLHAASKKRADLPLIGRRGEKNAIGGAIARAKNAADTLIDLDVRRLRNTWLIAAMCSPVPLADLMRAAGLTSSRTFADLLEYCPDTHLADIEAVLAKMDDVINGPAPEYAITKRRPKQVAP